MLKMMKNFRNIIFKISLVVSLVLANSSTATELEELYNETVLLHGLELGTGGRALALGGAYRALSDDLSALYWNPAGLASIRRVEFTLGISQAITQNEVTSVTSKTSSELSQTRLNAVGIVLPVPTYRGSLVFALGYHQVHGFDIFGNFEDLTEGNTLIGEELEEGRLGNWSLGMGLDLSPTASIGVALNLWGGYNDYSWQRRLDEIGPVWSTVDFSSDLEYIGFNILTGLIIRPNHWLRIGATIESPLKLSIDESYSGKYEGNEYIPDSTGLDSSLVSYSEYDSWGYEYSLARSFRAGLGVAFLVGPVILTADAVFSDWTQLSYSGDSPSEDISWDKTNIAVNKYLRSTVDLHLGTEVWIPDTPVRLQFGYAWLPSPFKNDEIISDKHVFSGGINTLLDQSLLVQTSLSWTGWERSIGGWGEDLQLTHLLMTLSYRF